MAPSPIYYVRKSLRSGPHGGVSVTARRSVAPDGVVAEWELIVMQVVKDGLVWRSETWNADPESEAAALARFDSLCAELDHELSP